MVTRLLKDAVVAADATELIYHQAKAAAKWKGCVPTYETVVGSLIELHWSLAYTHGAKQIIYCFDGPHPPSKGWEHGRRRKAADAEQTRITKAREALHKEATEKGVAFGMEPASVRNPMAEAHAETEQKVAAEDTYGMSTNEVLLTKEEAMMMVTGGAVGVTGLLKGTRVYHTEAGGGTVTEYAAVPSDTGGEAMEDEDVAADDSFMPPEALDPREEALARAVTETIVVEEARARYHSADLARKHAALDMRAAVAATSYSREEVHEIARMFYEGLPPDGKARVVITPGDAEGFCGLLSAKDKCKVVLSTDSDVLPFGGKIQLRFFQRKDQSIIHRAQMLRKPDPENKAGGGLDLTDAQFALMCVLAGCDYAPRIYKIGGASAFKLVKKHGADVEKCIAAMSKINGPHPDDDPVIGDVASPSALEGDEEVNEEPCLHCGAKTLNRCEGCGAPFCNPTCRSTSGHSRACFFNIATPYFKHAMDIFLHKDKSTTEDAVELSGPQKDIKDLVKRAARAEEDEGDDGDHPMGEDVGASEVLIDPTLVAIMMASRRK